MKITKELLKKLGCCEEVISNFMQTPELHREITAKKIIIYDRTIFNDFSYFLQRLKLYVVDELRCEFSDGSSEEYKYNSKGLLTKYEHFNGFKHSNNYWKTYEYNHQNLITKEKESTNSWWEYKYNSKGQRIESKYSGGRQYEYEYNSKGQLIKWECSDESWGKCEYNYSSCNSKDLLTKKETSYGYCTKYTYSYDQGLITKEEFSNGSCGYWKSYKYNSKGQITKEGNSNGSWKTYKYNSKDLLIKCEYSNTLFTTPEDSNKTYTGYDMNKIKFIFSYKTFKTLKNILEKIKKICKKIPELYECILKLFKP